MTTSSATEQYLNERASCLVTVLLMVSSQSVNDIPLMKSFAAEVHKKHSKWRRGRLQASKHTPNAVKRFTEEENAQKNMCWISRVHTLHLSEKVCK